MSDYWRASAKLMRDETKLAEEKGILPECDLSATVTSEEFVQIATRSFEAALQFASWCSNRSPKDLRSRFNMYVANPDKDMPEEADAAGACFGLGTCCSTEFCWV